MATLCAVQDELMSKVGNVTDRLNEVQSERDQLSMRVDQLQKLVQELNEGVALNNAAQSRLLAITIKQFIMFIFRSRILTVC